MAANRLEHSLFLRDPLIHLKEQIEDVRCFDDHTSLCVIGLLQGVATNADEPKDKPLHGLDIRRRKDGKAVAVKVRGVKPLKEPAKVYNLILEERGTFIANSFLVRSKPPAEK